MLAVVLLYDLVRRGFGVLAGLVAAAALAVLPAAVLTARSDTMDSVMAALLVLAAAALGALGARRGRLRAAIGAGVALWTVLAVLVLSAMGLFQDRYLETLTPALAAALGIGAAACALVVAGRTGRRTPGRAAVAALLFAAVLAIPAARSVALVESGAADGGTFGHMTNAQGGGPLALPHRSPRRHALPVRDAERGGRVDADRGRRPARARPRRLPVPPARLGRAAGTCCGGG
jgi:hypothetical protein